MEGVTDKTLQVGNDTPVGETKLPDGTVTQTVVRGGSKMCITEQPGPEDYKIADINLSGSEEVGAFILGIWLKGLRYIVGAFAISFFFTGCTIIYFVLRKQIDGAETDEIYYMEGEEELDLEKEAIEAEKEKKSE